MENLIFEILKMAGFIVVLFLCCLWLVDIAQVDQKIFIAIVGFQ